MSAPVGRRTFLKMAGVAAPAVAAFSCADKEEAARIGSHGASRSGLDRVGQGTVPLLRHRLRRDGRRGAGAGRGRAWRRGESRQQGPAVRQGLPPARPALRRRSSALPAEAPAGRVVRAHLVGRGTRPGRHEVRRDAEAAWAGRGRHVRFRPVDGVRRLRGPEVGEGRAARATTSSPTRACAWPAPSRASSRSSRATSRWGATRTSTPATTSSCGATTWPRCTRCCSAGCSRPSARSPRRASSTSPRAARRPPTTPTCTCSSSRAPTWRWPTASCTCSWRTGASMQPFIAENVVFRRGIEDLKTIGYGCFDEQAERYTFEDKPQPSSLDELTTFLADYTPEKVSEIDRRAGDADPRAGEHLRRSRRAARSACGAWA